MARLYPLDPGYARFLRESRLKAGLSQNDVALAVGVAEATIGKYERLAAPVPPKLREAISRLLSQHDPLKLCRPLMLEQERRRRLRLAASR